MSRVYWDSMLFIYLLEGHPAFAPQVKGLSAQAQARGDTICTSVFTLGEVLTGPRKAGLHTAVDAIKAYFRSGQVEILPFLQQTAEHYAELRASFKLTQPDAIHLASAVLAGADLFVTNDRQLLSLRIPGIRFMMDMEGRVY